MATVTRTYNLLADALMMPAHTWQMVWRTDFGSRYIGHSCLPSVFLPMAVLFSPFPFTGRYLWEDSLILGIYAGIASIRTAWEFLKAKFSKKKILIHADSVGVPLAFWAKQTLLKDHRQIRLLNESVLALLLACLFYYSGWDKLFGFIMFITGMMCLYIEFDFMQAADDERGAVRDTLQEAEHTRKTQQAVEEDMEQEWNRRQESLGDADGFWEVR